MYKRQIEGDTRERIGGQGHLIGGRDRAGHLAARAVDKLALELDAESLGHKLLNLCDNVNVGVVDKLVGNDGKRAEDIAGKVYARKLALACGQCGELVTLIGGGDITGRRIGRGVGTVDRYGQSALSVVLCGLFNNRRYVDYIGCLLYTS